MSRATAWKSFVSTAKSQSENAVAAPVAREPTSRTRPTDGCRSTASIARSPIVTHADCPERRSLRASRVAGLVAADVHPCAARRQELRHLIAYGRDVARRAVRVAALG